MRRFTPYVETPQEKRRRVGIENAVKRRARSRYRIQINLHGDGVDRIEPRRPLVYPKCSLPFQFTTKCEAWGYMEKIDPMKFFPDARSASVERC